MRNNSYKIHMYTDSESLNLYDDGIIMIIIFFCIAEHIKHVAYIAL